MNNGTKKRSHRLRGSARAGIRVGVFILAATCTVEITKLGWKTFQGRIGAPGGEVLIFPMMILLFYAGWAASKEWASFKKACRGTERRDYHASSSGSPAYKG